MHAAWTVAATQSTDTQIHCMHVLPMFPIAFQVIIIPCLLLVGSWNIRHWHIMLKNEAS